MEQGKYWRKLRVRNSGGSKEIGGREEGGMLGGLFLGWNSYRGTRQVGEGVRDGGGH